MSEIRVRFAPSPTGPLHIGGVRTALYNYLFAKQHNGSFILRIEDTDQTRFVSNAEQYIIESLNWAGIPYDEGPGKNEKYGPYKQSERKDIYEKYINKLLESGKAYYAFDTAEELNRLREKAEQNKDKFSYNHSNRLELNNSLKIGDEKTKQLIDSGHPYVIRLKIQPEQIIAMHDTVRGSMEVNSSTLDDKVLFKSDGLPTYHFANIVDDHLMKISHVIRGEEWLPSLPTHVLLYEAFGWNKPNFAHLPLILKPVGKGKLSKRDGDKLGFSVFPMNYTNPDTNETSSGFREDGYLPESFINMLAFLGWNPGTEKEFYNKQELIEDFSLEKISKSGAKFNPEKALWFNHEHIQHSEPEHLDSSIVYNLQKHNLELDQERINKAIQLTKERANSINDFWELTSYLFIQPEEYDAKALKKKYKENSESILLKCREILSQIPTWATSIIQQELKDMISREELNFGQVMPVLRLAIVGSLSGPDLFEILAFIGKQETISRIENIISFKKGPQ